MDLPGQAKAYRPTMNDTWRLYCYRVACERWLRAIGANAVTSCRMGSTIHWKGTFPGALGYYADWHQVSYDMCHNVCIVGNWLGLNSLHDWREFVPTFCAAACAQNNLKALAGYLLWLHETLTLVFP